MTDDDQQVCVVCQQRTPELGQVDEECRERIEQQLYALVGQVRRLEAAVTPSARRGDGVRVTTSKKTEASTPARLDALALLAPGNDTVTAMLHPVVRHWQTTTEADVTYVRRGWAEETPGGRLQPHAEVVTERRTIVEWHREFARGEDGELIQVADDDQIGVLPPREWLTIWARQWQELFRNVMPRRAATRYVANPPYKRMSTGGWAQLALNPAIAPVLAAMHTIKDLYEESLRDTVAGKTLGYSGDTSRWTRSDDPAADDLLVRFGPSQTSYAVANLAGYLLLWLDDACARPDLPIGDFARELRSLSGEMARVLGEQPDLIWLGRCPARIATIDDEGAETTRPCGAGLWQDPHASQVQCPRCHTSWGPRRVELLYLAQEMRRTWPVDRRRLYTAEERRTIRRPRCPSCGQLADIVWRDATGSSWPRTPVWQPVDATCPSGCDDVKQVI